MRPVLQGVYGLCDSLILGDIGPDRAQEKAVNAIRTLSGKSKGKT